MQKRGRKTKADLDVVVTIPKGPRAPSSLTLDQRKIWDQTVMNEPEGFFDTQGTQDLLKDYCRHRNMADDISDVINEFKVGWVKAPDGAKKLTELLRIREIEIRGAANLATKLRLTNQSRVHPEKAGTAARNKPREPKPWET